MCITNSIVYQVIDTLYNEGTALLKDKYLQQKVPNNLNSQINSCLKQSMGQGLHQAHPELSNKEDLQIRPKTVENRANNNLKHKKLKHFFLENSSKIEVLKQSNNQKIDSKFQQNKNNCLKCKYYNFDSDDQQSRLRQQKNKQINLESNRQKNQTKQNKKRKQMELYYSQEYQKYLNLKVKPIAYDYQSCNIIPLDQSKDIGDDKIDRKINDNNKKKNRKKNCTNDGINSVIKVSFNGECWVDPKQIIVKDVSGIRKKMQYKNSNRLHNNNKEINKINYDNFNNNGKRQQSMIPYMNLKEGVKLIQKNKKKSITAMNRHRSKMIVRQKQFKSFLGLSIQSINHQIGEKETLISRPMTKQTKRTAYTEQVRKIDDMTRRTNNSYYNPSNRSILWRMITEINSNQKVTINQKLFETIV